MPLILRLTGLSGNPHRNEWSIHEDGVEIGNLRGPTGEPARNPLVLVDHGYGAGALPRPH
jgi:hypothetical protein